MASIPFAFLHYSALAEETGYEFIYNSSELVSNLTDEIYQNSPGFNVELVQEVDKYLPSLIKLHKNGRYTKLDHELDMLKTLISDFSLLNESAYVNGNIELEIAKKSSKKDLDSVSVFTLDLNQEKIMDNSGHVLTNREMQKQNMRKKIVSKKTNYLPSNWQLSQGQLEEVTYKNFSSSRSGTKHYTHNFNMVWNQGDMFFAKSPSSSKGIIPNIQGEWNHVGMYSEGKIFHAFPDSKGVSIVDLSWWKQYKTLSQVGFTWQLKKPSGAASSMAAYKEITSRINSYLKSQLNTPYDFGLKKDHSTQYCSKLVWNALRYGYKDNRWLSEEGRKVDFDSNGGLFVMPEDIYNHRNAKRRRGFHGR